MIIDHQHQASVCQTCGDKGFKELLLGCSKCHISMEHRYCLAKIPVADDEDFKYTCGKCLVSSTKKTSSKQPLLRKFCPESPVREHSIDPSAAIEVPKTRQGNITSSVAQIEPMTPTHDKLLPSLLASVSKYFLNGINGSPDKIDHLTVVNAGLNIGEASTSSPVPKVGAKVQVRNICSFPETSVSDPSVENLLIEANMSKSKISPHCYGLNSIGDQELNRKRRRVVHEAVVKFDKLAEDQELYEVPVVQVDSVSSAGPLGSPSPHTSIQDPSYVYAQPIFDPTWRGCFEICREKIGRLVAHLSNKACSKVVEVAKLMPAVLCMKMLPRLELWPKSFSASAPTDENIALYFFPGTESVVKAFDELMNHIMEQDLALKVLIHNVELLIFSSKQLPLLYKMFNGKYYIWGVFRARDIH